MLTAHATMQDEQLQKAFVNTVTRNFSISKRWLDAHGGFDPMLSYSAKPDSGYGWEDVDIGARIYAAKGTIRYTRAGVFHPHLACEFDQPEPRRCAARRRISATWSTSTTSFAASARRWYVDTADRIVAWAQSVGDDVARHRVAARRYRGAEAARSRRCSPICARSGARYRILTHRWHVPHQCEIYKLPFDFTLLTGTGTGSTNSWSYDQRPLRANVRLVSIGGCRSVRSSTWRSSILTRTCSVPISSNGVLGAEWGDTFRWFMENIRLPMVGVCHGTVPFVGQYAANPDPIAEFETYQADADELRERLADMQRRGELPSGRRRVAIQEIARDLARPRSAGISTTDRTSSTSSHTA